MLNFTALLVSTRCGLQKKLGLGIGMMQARSLARQVLLFVTLARGLVKKSLCLDLLTAGRGVQCQQRSGQSA